MGSRGRQGQPPDRIRERGAASGGGCDPRSLQQSYQQVDAETLVAVVMEPPKLRSAMSRGIEGDWPRSCGNRSPLRSQRWYNGRGALPDPLFDDR